MTINRLGDLSAWQKARQLVHVPVYHRGFGTPRMWGNGADFAPEFLLELMQRQQRHAA